MYENKNTNPPITVKLPITRQQQEGVQHIFNSESSTL